MQKGVGGGNFLILAEHADAALAAAEAAVLAMTNRPGVILPFPGGVVRSGSKVGSKRYKTMLATTNEAFSPTLRAIAPSALPQGVNSVLEIVLDGTDAPSIEAAMRLGIRAACLGAPGGGPGARRGAGGGDDGRGARGRRSRGPRRGRRDDRWHDRGPGRHGGQRGRCAPRGGARHGGGRDRDSRERGRRRRGPDASWARCRDRERGTGDGPRHDRRNGGGVRRDGVRRRPLDEARLDCRVRPGRPPSHLPLRLHLPAAARAAAAPLSAGAAGARRRRPLDHGALRPLLRRPGRARKGRNAAMGGGVSGDGLGLNERAWLIADQMVANADALRIGARTLANGARVIDAGIDRPGGYGAGLALARICMGGLGAVEYVPVPIAGETWPGVHVSTDHPAVSCMAAQYAGWAIQVEKYFAMGSGPLRAHARVEKELFQKLGYGERARRGVLVLETRTPPTEAVATWVGQKAGLEPSQLTFVVAPTASLAGGVQIAARILETGLHKMDTLGFDLREILSGIGTAPLPPVAKNDLRAIGRTNDCILYGGAARYTVTADDAELAELVPKIPASASKDYGTPFYDIFKPYDGDVYKLDPLLFSPAEVWLTSAGRGKTD